MRFGGGGVFLTTAVGHRLAAAGLLERILHRAAEPLKEFQGGDANFREKGVDVTGDEESDLHRQVPPRPIPRAGRGPRGWGARQLPRWAISKRDAKERRTE